VSRAGTPREGLPLQQRKILFESPGTSVIDFRCQAHVEPAGPEVQHRTSGLVFVRRGIFRWIRERDEFLADPTSILFFNHSEPCRFAHPVAGGDDCTVVTLDTPQALELVARHSPRDAEDPAVPFQLGYGACSSRAAWLHCELLARTRQGSALAIEDVLAELTDEAMRATCQSHARSSRKVSTTGSARRRHRDLAEAAKLQLNEHLQSPPSLRELALRLDCSPFHLSRTFHRTVGISLRQYHARLRARIAAQALARGASDLTQLALGLGYADHSHFSKAFRGEWGLPPSRFRRYLGSQAEKRPSVFPASA
jgi:AraC-like DNA-binding protein